MLNDNIIQSSEYNMNVNLPIKGTIENDVMKYFFSNHFIVNNAMVRKNINLEANNDKKYRISMQTFIIKMNHNCGSDDYMDAIHAITHTSDDNLVRDLATLVDIYW